MTIESFSTEVWETGSDGAQTTETELGAGQVLAARVPLGQRASDGLFYQWDPAANDGTEKAVRMTSFAVDTTGGAAKHQAIKSGTFNPELVGWPTSTAIEQAIAFVGSPISLQAPR